MTDQDVTKFSNGEIKNGGLFKTRGVTGLTEEKDGLFDPAITGGSSGNRWSHIKLATPMPNPIFEDAIKTVLGIKQKEFDALLGGQLVAAPDGVLQDAKDPHSKGLPTGGAAMRHMLANVDMDGRIKQLRKEARSSTPTTRRSGTSRPSRRMALIPRSM